MIHKPLYWIYWGTKELKYHQTWLKENSSRKTNVDPKSMRYSNEDHHQAPYKKINMKTRRNLNQDRFFKVKKDGCRDSKHIEGFQCSAKNINAQTVTSLVISIACATGNMNHIRGQDHPKHTNWPAVDYLHKIIQYTEIQVIIHPVKMNHPAFKWRYKLYKLMTSTQHPNICLPIWNSKSSCTRTKPSSWKPELAHAQM